MSAGACTSDSRRVATGAADGDGDAAPSAAHRDAPDALRLRLLEWRLRCGWSCHNLGRALKSACQSVPVSTLEHFCAGRGGLRPEQRRMVTAFLDRWPMPGPFEEWRAALARGTHDRHAAEADAIAARADAVRAARAAHVRACLAAERPPLRPRTRWPGGVMPTREMLADGFQTGEMQP